MNDAVEYHDQKIASNWNEKYEHPTFKLRIELVSQLVDDFGLESRSWLDAGCGTGVFSRLLVDKGMNVLGVDASENMLQVARESSQNCDNKASFTHIETIESLPFDNERFDGIVCSSVLEYVERPQDCLSEFRRVLTSRGCLILSVPNTRSLVRQMHGVRYYAARAIGKSQSEFYGHSRNSYTISTIKSLLDSSGFVTQRVVQLGAYLPMLGLSRSNFISPLIFAVAQKLD